MATASSGLPACGFLILVLLPSRSKSGKTARPGIAVLSLLHDLVVGLLYLFKPLLRLIFIRIVNIRIGMVPPA